MKHKLIVAACLVVLVVLGAASIIAWQNETVRSHAVALRQSATEAYKRKVQEDTIKDRYNQLNEGCHKGQAAWDASKVKIGQRPVCDLQIVQ